jgi:hypothetical protein
MELRFTRFEDFVAHIKGMSWEQVRSETELENANLQPLSDWSPHERRKQPDLVRYDTAIAALRVYLRMESFPAKLPPHDKQLILQIQQELESRGQWRPKNSP